MRIMINEPDGRLSGIVVGETIGVSYDHYFKFKDLNGKTGEETISALQEAIDKISAQEAQDYEGVITGKMLDLLTQLLNLAKKHPKGQWRVAAY